MTPYHVQFFGFITIGQSRGPIGYLRELFPPFSLLGDATSFRL
jgi:hypothetical protein